MRTAALGLATGLVGVTFCMGCNRVVCLTTDGSKDTAGISSGHVAVTDDSGRRCRGIRRLLGEKRADARYDVSYENTPLSEVIRDFDKCKVGCQFSYFPLDQYTGTVSITMEHVTWADALEEILADHGLQLNVSDSGPAFYTIRKREGNRPRPSQSGTGGWYSTETNHPIGPAGWGQSPVPQ